MFTRADEFCDVCRRAITAVIDSDVRQQPVVQFGHALRAGGEDAVYPARAPGTLLLELYRGTP